MRPPMTDDRWLTAVGGRSSYQIIMHNKINLRSRRGLSEMFTLVLALPFFIALIGLLLYFGRALYVKAAIEDAAATGARFATTSLSGHKGCVQALEAMQLVLAGHTLDPNVARFDVRPLQAWGVAPVQR